MEPAKAPAIQMNNDKHARIAAYAGILTSLTIPVISYLFLNQVERDNRDRQRLFSWVDTTEITSSNDTDWTTNHAPRVSQGNTDACKRLPKSTHPTKPTPAGCRRIGPTTASTEVTIWIRKEGVLDVENVQFVIQTDNPKLTQKTIRLDGRNLLECDPPIIDGGRIRIKLKNTLAPTESDMPIHVSVVALESAPPVSIQGAWLQSKVSAATTLQINPRRHDPPSGPPGD
jgi:hypothetical protein